MRNIPLPLFGDAYLADTRHLSLEEHGAYLQLLMIAWRLPGGILPDDDARLAKMLGVTPGRWAKLKPQVMNFWTLRAGEGWTQKRLARERAWADEKRRKNILAAGARRTAQVTENTSEGGSERPTGRSTPPTPTPSVPLGTGAPPDPVKDLIDAGVALLTATGEREKGARSLIGRWRKQHGDAATRAALAEAVARGISRPAEWIGKRLAGQAQPQAPAPANFVASVSRRYGVAKQAATGPPEEMANKE